MENFLPKDYSVPVGESNYMRFQQGDNLFRILAPPIVGWEDWVEEDGKKKPVRFKMDLKPNQPFNPKRKIKHFWAMPVWNYNDERVQILEITQSGIQSKIKSLVDDEDWGKPFDYDIKVIRNGEGIETEYSVNPKPKKAVDESVDRAFSRIKVNLEALFENKDPFEKEIDVSGIDF